MKVINNGKIKDVIVLTYFSLNNKKEYILYTVKQTTKDRILYLANVKRMETVTSLFKPDKEDLPLLQSIIKTILEKETNLSLFVKNDFKFIEPKQLDDVKIKEISSKSLLLEEASYEKLLTNKYLTYPVLKIMNMDEIQGLGYDKNNEEAVPASILILLIYVIMIVIFQTVLMFMKVNTTDLMAFNAVTLTLSSLIIALISMTAFNFEEKEPLKSFGIIYMMIFIFTFLLNAIQSKILLINSLIISLALTIVFSVPYIIAKKVSFKAVNKLRARNYVTYYIFYLITFLPIIIGMIFINSKLFQPVVNTIIK